MSIKIIALFVQVSFNVGSSFELSRFDATASHSSFGLCKAGVLWDFSEDELPLVNVDDSKSQVRKFKKLVRTSQKATTRKVLQTLCTRQTALGR